MKQIATISPDQDFAKCKSHISEYFKQNYGYSTYNDKISFIIGWIRGGDQNEVYTKAQLGELFDLANEKEREEDDENTGSSYKNTGTGS